MKISSKMAILARTQPVAPKSWTRSYWGKLKSKFIYPIEGFGCMVRDRKRFADTGGWEWAQFDYDPASATFTPNTSLQWNDAKCGFAGHTIVKAKDYVFTEYPTR
jgi:hypothetical protein